MNDAVRAGADSVEHGIDLDDETLAEMKKRGTVWVPTIDHNRYYVDARDEYGFTPGADAAAARLHPEEPRVGAPRDQGGRDHRHGIGRRLLRVRPEHARARLVRQGRHDARAGAATATTIPAGLLGMRDGARQLAPGFFADIVAVDGDPLDDIDVVVNEVRG